MKRLLVILISLLFVFSFSSCTSKNTSDEGAESKNTSKNDDSDNSDFTIFDTGMLEFVSGYMHAKKHFEAVVGTPHSKSPKVPEKYILEMLRYETQSDNILDDVSLCIYLDDASAGEVTGKHALFGCKCFKKKEGDRILSGYKHIYEKDSSSHLAGDTSTENTSFDTSKKYLIIEECITRNGSIYKKGTTELLLLDDGTYIMQHFWFSAKSSKVTCAFVKLNENNKTLTTYLGEGNTSEDYAYLSLSSAKDISIDELSKDYSIDFIIKAENGKASYKKIDKSFSRKQQNNGQTMLRLQAARNRGNISVFHWDSHGPQEGRAAARLLPRPIYPAPASGPFQGL